MEYKTVSREAAITNRYYGLGGWLMFLYIWTALGVIVMLADLLQLPDPKLLEASFGENVSALRSSQIWSLAIGAVLVVVTPIKRSFVPKIWIGLTWIGWIAGFMDYTLGSRAEAELAVYGILIGLLIALALTWYFINSKRVNITYRNRVPVDQVISGYSVDLTKHNRMVAGPGVGTKLIWYFGGVFGFLLLLVLLLEYAAIGQ